MHFTTLAAAAVLSVAQAIDVQVVSVGMNPVNGKTGTMFWPEKITAAAGSMVQFQFLAGNHTATQSNFDNPCTPIQDVVPTAPGIFSSFQPVAASKDMGQMPVFTIMINDTKPLWFYCSQGPHCMKGMSMVINENTAANSSRSLENYKTSAAGTSGGDGGSGNGTYGGGSGGSGGSPTTELPPAATTDTSGGGIVDTTAVAQPTDGAAVTSGGAGSPTSTPVVGAAAGLAASGSMVAFVGAAAYMLL